MKLKINLLLVECHRKCKTVIFFFPKLNKIFPLNFLLLQCRSGTERKETMSIKRSKRCRVSPPTCESSPSGSGDLLYLLCLYSKHLTHQPDENLTRDSAAGVVGLHRTQ